MLAEGPTGSLIEHRVEVHAEPGGAYAAFLRLGAWWSSAHSFSVNARNLTVGARPAGCRREALSEGGFARRTDVVHGAPGTMLVFSGGLGPLPVMGLAGSLTASFASAPGVSPTTVTARSDLGGRDERNFAGISAAVDGVLGEQMARYRNFVATDAP